MRDLAVCYHKQRQPEKEMKMLEEEEEEEVEDEEAEEEPQESNLQAHILAQVNTNLEIQKPRVLMAKSLYILCGNDT